MLSENSGHNSEEVVVDIERYRNRIRVIGYDSHKKKENKRMKNNDLSKTEIESFTKIPKGIILKKTKTTFIPNKAINESERQWLT